MKCVTVKIRAIKRAVEMGFIGSGSWNLEFFDLLQSLVSQHLSEVL